jgi:hypothetical protein
MYIVGLFYVYCRSLLPHAPQGRFFLRYRYLRDFRVFVDTPEGGREGREGGRERQREREGGRERQRERNTSLKEAHAARQCH